MTWQRRAEFGGWLLLLAATAQAGARAATLPVGSAHAAQHGAQPHTPGYLGIGFHDASGRGVEVMMVDHDGPAGQAGLRPHDVILSLNGQAVNSSELLVKTIHEAGAGAEVSLSYVRDGQTKKVSVQLADRQEVERIAQRKMAAADPGPIEADQPAGAAESFADPVPPGTAPHGQSFLGSVLHTTPFTGLGLQAMEPQLAGYFGAPIGVGLLVETVAPNSPGAAAGLRAGDVILKADSIDVKSNGMWVRQLHDTRGRGIVLVVLRDKQEQRILLIPQLKKHSKVDWPLLAGTQPVFG